MREATIIVRALDVQLVASSAAAGGLYDPTPNAQGDLEPLVVKEEKGQAAPCFEVAVEEDRSGQVLLHVTARGEQALAWLQELATLDTQAQTAAQTDRRVQRELEREAERRAELEREAERRAEANSVESSAQGENAGVSVTLTEPTDWQPADDAGELELEDEPTPAPPEARTTPTETVRAKKRKRPK